MPILSFRRVTFGLGSRALLDDVNFSVERGERLCLVGRNGAGKSTLLRLVSGDVLPDEGEIVRAQGLRVAQLAQEVPTSTTGTVFQVVAAGLGNAGSLLDRYHRLSQEITGNDPAQLAELERCQHELESVNGWALQQRVEATLSRLGLPADSAVDTLSGGLKRRVMLARALVGDPDLLLLDEPTNHLDIDAIRWLEDFLLTWEGTLLFVTHDRAFLDRLATRIIELDRGRLADFPGSYSAYLSRKEAMLAEEERHNALFDKKLAQEEVWIRQGIKARRTRNEGRVRALERMRAEHAARRERGGSARILVQEAERSGKIVIEAEHVDFEYDGKTVIRDFSTLILRGDRIGIIGPNGVGKTTLLRLLLGQTQPTRGILRHGTRLEIAYFDQYRAVLDEDKSVQDNLDQGRDMVTVNGQPRHVLSYLQDFLFEPARARQPVKALSGGERNRLLLARLFLRPSNVLVLDEPTNDLDSDTLELLEERLLDYAGTVLLVSHDRAFLNNVVGSTFVFEGDGIVNQYVGGYDDWLRQRAAPPVPAPQPASPAARRQANRESSFRKLSYQEQRELDGIPPKIETLETEREALQTKLAAPDFYRQEKAAIMTVQQRLQELDAQLAQAYSRWEELESIRNAANQ